MCGKGYVELDTPELCIVFVQQIPKEVKDTDFRYEDLFHDSLTKPAAITKLFSSLLEMRQDSSASNTGPSHSHGEGNDRS